MALHKQKTTRKMSFPGGLNSVQQIKSENHTTKKQLCENNTLWETLNKDD